MQFSFMRKVPTSLKEMYEAQEEKYAEFEKLLAKKNAPDNSEGLFDPDAEAEDTKPGAFSQDLFYEDDYVYEDDQKELDHLEEMRKEHKELLRSMRGG